MQCMHALSIPITRSLGAIVSFFISTEKTTLASSKTASFIILPGSTTSSLPKAAIILKTISQVPLTSAQFTHFIVSETGVSPTSSAIVLSLRTPFTVSKVVRPSLSLSAAPPVNVPFTTARTTAQFSIAPTARVCYQHDHQYSCHRPLSLHPPPEISDYV